MALGPLRGALKTRLASFWLLVGIGNVDQIVVCFNKADAFYTVPVPCSQVLSLELLGIKLDSLCEL
jgi:hypothetical protein